MDYKEKYEKLHKNTLAALQQMVSEGKITEEIARSICADFVKESEDERIRKEIINWFHSYNGCTKQVHPELIDSWLAWLEKQGEQLNSYSGVSFKYNGHIWAMYANCNGVDISLDNQFLKHFEMLVEQNPADKVEPKFKIEEGKWYVCISQFCNCIEGRAYKAISDNRIMDDFGTEYDMHSNAYKYFRPWTIQDAKDGDVLVAKISEEPNDFIYIFNGYDKDGFWSHCYLDAYVNKFHEGIYHNNHNVGVPATKEQRELLFQKMKDAGYVWDVGKKELKKIEQKSIWSEEDENMFSNVDESLLILSRGKYKWVKEQINSERNWLKSLKERLKGE